MRVNSTIEGPDHTIYSRDYVIDYTSEENNDIMEYNVGTYQWQGTKKVHDLRHTYDACGNLTEKTGETVQYSYTYDGRLAQADHFRLT